MPVIESNRLKPIPTVDPPPPSNGKSRWLLLLFIGIGAILLFNEYKGTDFLVEDEEGNLQLSEKRQKKLEQKLKELEEAEQYALLAAKPGYYPCYSCPESNLIFLLPAEVWKYGITTKGKNGRYKPKFIEDNNLLYVVQFEGSLQDCLIEEQIKIYNYALRPENLKRDIPLKRPPGNKVDH